MPRGSSALKNVMRIGGVLLLVSVGYAAGINELPELLKNKDDVTLNKKSDTVFEVEASMVTTSLKIQKNDSLDQKNHQVRCIP